LNALELTMKFLLIPLALIAGNALACPGDSSKDAMAPATSKPVATANAAPSSAKVTAPVASTKAVSKVATKSATEPRKTAPL
jgi:hypothetical protein